LFASALCLCGCSPSAEQRIEKVGGVSIINQEARVVFDRFGTKEFRFLYESDLKDCPAIAALGNSVGLYNESPGTAAQIRVRYGSHSNTKFIFILDPRAPSQFKGPPGCSQIASNIFVSP
jgi:hypothetical protein